jgi:nucleoside-diphosphate-sugar epimerase
MRLFITGATGYIGFHVATALRRAGYEVWGLTGSQQGALWLARNEIRPVIGSMQQPESFKAFAVEVDMLVHAAIDYQADSVALDTATVQALFDAARSSRTSKTLIYTSGVWVYGNTHGRPATEEAPLAPAQAVAWRPAVEQLVLNADGVRGIVIRPGVVYGRGGGLTGLWFEGASNGGVLQVVGDGYNHWAMVHVDDLAWGYLRVAQSKASGEVFNLVDSSRATVMEMASAAAQAVGKIRQIEFIPVDEAAQEMGAMAEALALNQMVDAAKARRLLDWEPKHLGFIDEVDTYYRAWQASQQS